MEADVDALHRPAHQVTVAHVTVDDGQSASGMGVGEIGSATSDEVVEDDDLADAALQQLIDQMGTYRPRAAGDQAPGPAEVDVAHRWCLSGTTAPLNSRLVRAASRTSSTRSPAQPSVRGGRPDLIEDANSDITD